MRDQIKVPVRLREGTDYWGTPCHLTSRPPQSQSPTASWIDYLPVAKHRVLPLSAGIHVALARSDSFLEKGPQNTTSFWTANPSPSAHAPLLVIVRSESILDRTGTRCRQSSACFAEGLTRFDWRGAGEANNEVACPWGREIRCLLCDDCSVPELLWSRAPLIAAEGRAMGPCLP